MSSWFGWFMHFWREIIYGNLNIWKLIGFILVFFFQLSASQLSGVWERGVAAKVVSVWRLHLLLVPVPVLVCLYHAFCVLHLQSTGLHSLCSSCFPIAVLRSGGSVKCTMVLVYHGVKWTMVLVHHGVSLQCKVPRWQQLPPAVMSQLSEHPCSHPRPPFYLLIILSKHHR